MNNKFAGFRAPGQNWFRMPAEWIGITSTITSLGEMKIVEYVLRHTWGFLEYGEFKRITLDEFENGRKKKNGERMDGGTGLTRKSIIQGIKKAIEDGYLEEKIEGDNGRLRKFYRLKLIDGDQYTSFPLDQYTSYTKPVYEVNRTSIQSILRSEKDTNKKERNGGALKKRPRTRKNEGPNLVQTDDWDKKAAGHLREVLVLHDADIVAPPRSVRVPTLAKHIAALRFRRKVPKEQVRDMVKWMKIHYSEPWCPKIHKAADVFDKWGKFRDAKLRQESDSGEVPENKHPRADLVARVREWLERERGLWCENYPTQEDTDEALQHFGEKPGTLKWNEIE